MGWGGVGRVGECRVLTICIPSCHRPTYSLFPFTPKILGVDDAFYELAPGTVYLIAFYWSITTLTTIGYGDIVPQCQEEYALVMVGMVFGATTWAYVIGSITLIVSTLDVEAVWPGFCRNFT